MPVQQITVSDNFSYVVFCQRTGKAAVIDPSTDSRAQLRFIEEMGLELLYIIDTHHHMDHTAENMVLKKRTGAKVVASREEAGRIYGGVDLQMVDGQKLKLGDLEMEFILTPGHTEGGMCVLLTGEALFTGDTLFIGDCGRADLPGGDIKKLFESLQKLKGLPDGLIVYPGHDYGPKPFDTLGNQKRTNRTLLTRNLDEFMLLP